MKLGEFLIRLGVTNCTLRPGMSRDTQIIIMPEESDGFDVKDIIYFQSDGQMWVVIDEDGDRWLTQDEDDVEEDRGPPDDAPLCEREGDMCALPDIAGEPMCTNPFCKDGMTDIGKTCLRCEEGKRLDKQQQQKPDVCELSKHRAKRA